MSPQKFQDLFQKYLDKTCTEAEKTELMQVVQSGHQELELNQLLLEAFQNTDGQIKMKDHAANDILNTILNNDDIKQPAKIISLKQKRSFWPYVAAASIIMALALGSYIFLANQNEQPPLVHTTPAMDIQAPESNRATITLENGQIIYLDSLSNGMLVQQSGVQVRKLEDGQIVYEGTAAQNLLHTLYNPRGSRVIDIRLSDGSRIWLNAGSSITYPATFSGKERNVSMTGEAYFEVANNPSKPFKLSKGETTVTVMGTRFNVNAYDDEANLKVTLLEGAVSVNKNSKNNILKPGQQAVVDESVNVINHVELDKVMAWKNGLFNFEGAGLQEVMRQLARWYDIEVVYEKEIPQMEFGGKMSRNVPLSDVLKGLKDLNVNFKIERGRRLIVKP